MYLITSFILSIPLTISAIIIGYGVQKIIEYSGYEKLPIRANENDITASYKEIAINHILLFILLTLLLPLCQFEWYISFNLLMIMYEIIVGIGMVIIGEFLGYILNRIYHTNWGYKNIHYRHHLNKNPQSFSDATLATPLDFILIAITSVSYVLFITQRPIRSAIALGFQAIQMQIIHSGYDIPRLVPYAKSAYEHWIHHQDENSNYADYLIIYDKICGTYRSNNDKRSSLLIIAYRYILKKLIILKKIRNVLLNNEKS